MALGLGILDVLAINMVTTARAASESDMFSPDLLSASAPVIFFGLISVWFSGFFGNFFGPTTRGGYVDVATPPYLFVVFGCFLLCIPIVLFLITLFFPKIWS